MDEVSNQMGIQPLPQTNYKVRKTLKGHSSKIYAMHWSPSQPYLVSAGQDGKLIVWNGISGNKILAIPLRSPWVMTCAFSQSGNLIASGGLDNRVSIWDTKSKDTSPLLSSRIIAEMMGHSGYVSCVRFITEEQIVSSSGDTYVILWDITRSKPILRFEEHDADVMSVAVDQPQSIIVTGACDSFTKVWDLRTGNCVRTFAGHEADVNCVRFVVNLFAPFFVSFFF